MDEKYNKLRKVGRRNKHRAQLYVIVFREHLVDVGRSFMFWWHENIFKNQKSPKTSGRCKRY